jgi:hypothetical protein
MAPTGPIRRGDLIADSHGDLFGTTTVGGANNDDTVFEIAKTAHGYASKTTTLASFNGTCAMTREEWFVCRLRFGHIALL